MLCEDGQVCELNHFDQRRKEEEEDRERERERVIICGECEV